jgi:hypothetical protein
MPSADGKAPLIVGRNPDIASLDPNVMNVLVINGTSSKIVLKPAELASPLVASLGGSVILHKCSQCRLHPRILSNGLDEVHSIEADKWPEVLCGAGSTLSFSVLAYNARNIIVQSNGV